MSTLVEELEQAADELVRAADNGEFEGYDWHESRAIAARLRQRAAWVRELEARWKRERYQYGLPPASQRDAELGLKTLSLLTGPIPATETAPTERTEP